MGKKINIREYVDKIKPWLQRGLTINEACIQAGVPSRTIYNYIERTPLLGEELERYQNHTIALAETMLADALNYEMQKPVQDRKLWDAKWLLERRKRDKYALQQNVKQEGTLELEHKGNVEATYNINVKNLSKKELQNLLAMREKLINGERVEDISGEPSKD